jgi:hypothetical protein
MVMDMIGKKYRVNEEGMIVEEINEEDIYVLDEKIISGNKNEKDFIESENNPH